MYCLFPRRLSPLMTAQRAVFRVASLLLCSDGSLSLGGEEALARRRRSKDDHRDCEPLTDENLDIEVIRAGRDSNGDSASHARHSVLKVSCSAGFKLNLQKRKIRCKRGEWRPGLPQCLPIGCTLPNLPEVGGGGHFTLGGQVLRFDSKVSHGEDVDVECHEGYFLSGPSRLRCWYVFITVDQCAHGHFTQRCMSTQGTAIGQAALVPSLACPNASETLALCQTSRGRPVENTGAREPITNRVKSFPTTH